MKRLAVIAVGALAAAHLAPSNARAQAADDVPTPHPVPASRTPTVPADTESDIISSDNQNGHWAVGARVRGMFVPAFMISPFVQQMQNPDTSFSVGGEVTRRKGALDIVMSLDWSSYSVPDGNWLQSGKDPILDTHYFQFRGMSLLSADVSFLYAPDLTRRLSLLIGGGIGLGIVFGDAYDINNSKTVCNATNPGDASKCYPVVDPMYYSAYGNPVPTYTNSGGQEVALTGNLKPGDPEFQQKLDGLQRSFAACQATGKGDCRDTAEHPYFHKLKDVPPVLPVINFLIGFRVKLVRHFNVNVTGGFRNGFFIGGGPEYVF